MTLQRGFDITRNEQRPGRVPVVSSGGISSYHDTAKQTGPGVIIGRKGSLGTVFYVEGDYWPHDTTLWIKDFHGNDERFSYYFFKNLAPQLLNMDVGAANPTLNRNHVHPIEILWPPLPEQRRIAKILGDLDDKIELNGKMNETLEAMAKSLFKSWFVDFDPVKAKMEGRQPEGMDAETAALFPDKLVESELGMIPEGWEVGSLGEIASLDKGLSYKGEFLSDDDGMPMVSLGCFTGRGVFNQEKMKRYTGEYGDRHLVRAGDLVVANTDMTQNRVIIGSPALIPESQGAKEFLFTHHVYAVRFKPESGIWCRYVFFTLLMPEFREVAEGFSTGTTVLALPRDGMMNYSFCLPPIPLLLAFEKQVGPQLTEVDANSRQARTLASLREALLLSLISGKANGMSTKHDWPSVASARREA